MHQAGAAAAVQGSRIGALLRRRSTAIILGQGLCRTLFIHAGLPLKLLRLVQTQTINEPDAILAKVNQLMTGLPTLSSTAATVLKIKVCSLHICDLQRSITNLCWPLLQMQSSPAQRGTALGSKPVFCQKPIALSGIVDTCNNLSRSFVLKCKKSSTPYMYTA